MSLDLADRALSRPWDLWRVILWPVSPFASADDGHPFLVVSQCASFAISPPMAAGNQCCMAGLRYRYDRLGD